MLLVWVCGFSGLDLWRTCLGPISGHHHYESQAQAPNMRIFWDKFKRNHSKPKRRDYLLILVLLESETRSVWQRPVPVPKPENLSDVFPRQVKGILEGSDYPSIRMSPMGCTHRFIYKYANKDTFEKGESKFCGIAINSWLFSTWYTQGKQRTKTTKRGHDEHMNKKIPKSKEDSWFCLFLLKRINYNYVYIGGFVQVRADALRGQKRVLDLL